MCDHIKENGGNCCGECDRNAAVERILCEICDEKRPADEVDKDWRSPGWSVCEACEGDGSADLALAEHLSVHAVLEDARYMADKYIEICKMFNYNC
jgi:hypothetical protein